MLKNEIFVFLDEKILDSIESRAKVTDNNCYLAGTYDGEIDAYKNLREFLTEGSTSLGHNQHYLLAELKESVRNILVNIPAIYNNHILSDGNITRLDNGDLVITMELKRV